MFRKVLRRFTAPVVEATVLSATERWGTLPRPDDSTRVYAMGPDPDRILLFGAGGVAGVGVSSNELGLGGQLARLLSSLTGRGTDVEIDGQPNRSLVRTARDLADRDLSRYDALVVLVGAREAIGLRPARLWRRDMRALVAQLAVAAPAGLAVFMVGHATLPKALNLPERIARIVDRHSAVLNRETQLACRGTIVRYLAFEPRDAPQGSRYGGASTYAAWAEPIALGVRHALDAATSVIRESVVDDEEVRLRALEELIDLHDTADVRFDPVVKMARDLFGVPGAALNFIDRENQWTYAGAEVPRGMVPRAGTFCSVAIERDEIMVVPDTDLDPRFANHTNGEGPTRIRFYAGYPIESPGGQRLGTFCIFDVTPRAFSPEDASLLRELALRAQSVLWAGQQKAPSRR